MNEVSDGADGQKYLRWLAEAMVRNLGHDRAVEVCREMNWRATLDFLTKGEGRASAGGVAETQCVARRGTRPCPPARSSGRHAPVANPFAA